MRRTSPDPARQAARIIARCLSRHDVPRERAPGGPDRRPAAATVQVKVSILDRDPRILPRWERGWTSSSPTRPGPPDGSDGPDPSAARWSGRRRADRRVAVARGRLEPRPVEAGPVSGGFRTIRSGSPAASSAVIGHRGSRPAAVEVATADNDGEEARMALVELRDVHKSFWRGRSGSRSSRASPSTSRRRASPHHGAVGSGKSTLLNLVAGLDKPSSGEVRVAGSEVSAMSSAQLAPWRSRHVGFVFQQLNLLPVLTAFQNVELPLLLTSLRRKEREERVRIALRVVGLEDRMAHYPRQLSGGQEQRVAVARAIVADPTLILLDEPTGQLDARSSREVLDLLSRLHAEFRKTIIVSPTTPTPRPTRKRCCTSRKGSWSKPRRARVTPPRAGYGEPRPPQAADDPHRAERGTGAVPVRLAPRPWSPPSRRRRSSGVSVGW